ncbi:MAG: hypothetical protein AAB446_01140 [Patescibacteria group bacterium]
MINIIKQKAEVMVMHRATKYALIFFIFAATIFYMYFVNLTVRTLTVLERTKDQMQSLSVLVSEMESKRLSIENSVSTEKALNAGFVEVNNPIFIMRNQSGVTLSLKTD